MRLKARSAIGLVWLGKGDRPDVVEVEGRANQRVQLAGIRWIVVQKLRCFKCEQQFYIVYD
jgi:hypothetical protein